MKTCPLCETAYPSNHTNCPTDGALLIESRQLEPGTVIRGKYRIERQLGRGGMGTVYLAEHILLGRQRALKFISSELSQDSTFLRRFRREAQAATQLQHPNVVQVVDLDQGEDGSPYMAMEYVEGPDLRHALAAGALPVERALAIARGIAQGLGEAHAKGIIHRDVKPENILLAGGNGAPEIPKLLDFGIAKLLAPESLSHTLPVTRLQERILTPENAAPEQVLGRPITTATDIYSLGVLLYRLLTGRSPYRLLSYSQLQLERAICMDDPVRPSQMVVAKLSGEADADRSRISDRRGLSPQRLRARLSGDLDAVVAKAMRKEPDRRYQSVEALADDLNRHLLGLPVLARQADWRYNGAKFMRRHLLAVSGAAVIFLGLAAIAAVTLWQNHRIELARQATAQERDHAQQVSAFLVDVFSQADPFNAQGREPTAKDLLERGAERISGNTALQPEVRAQLLESIGLAYRRQGLSERAIPLFEQAVAIRREERPFDPHRTAVALANLARALTDNGHLVSSQAYLEQALDMSRGGDQSPSPETAGILVQFGEFELDAKSDPQEASKLLNQGLEIYRGLGNQHLAVASTLNSLAATALWLGDFPLAERYQRESVTILQATVSRNHPEYAKALATLGYILTQRDRYQEAEQMLNEALEIERTVFGANNQRVAEIESHLGILYERQGDLPRAIQTTQIAVRIATERLGMNHYFTGYYLDNLASLYLKANDLSAAEHYAREALAVYAQTLPARHLYVSSTRRLLGEILLQRRSLAAAETELRAAVDIDASLAGADSWRAARSEATLGWALILGGKAEEGEPMLVAARNRLIAAVGAANPATQMASTHLAEYFRAHHRDAEAAAVLAGVHKG